MKHTFFFGLGFCALVACSSSTTSSDPTSPAADSGSPSSPSSGVFTRGADTFTAFPFVPVDGTAYASAIDDTSTTVRSKLRIVLADRASICSTGYDRPNAKRLVIELESTDKAVAAGTYTYSLSDANGGMTAVLDSLDATCNAETNARHYLAMAGTVVLTTASGSDVAGQIDLTFANDKSTLSGAFAIKVCVNDQSAAMSCQQ